MSLKSRIISRDLIRLTIDQVNDKEHEHVLRQLSFHAITKNEETKCLKTDTALLRDTHKSRLSVIKLASTNEGKRSCNLFSLFRAYARTVTRGSFCRVTFSIQNESFISYHCPRCFPTSWLACVSCASCAWRSSFSCDLYASSSPLPRSRTSRTRCRRSTSTSRASYAFS